MMENWGNVKTIRGEDITDSRSPNPDLIGRLEEALQKAKAGEIVSAGIVVLYSDLTAEYEISDGLRNSAMVGCAYRMTAAIANG